jgi:hypothetical protein
MMKRVHYILQVDIQIIIRINILQIYFILKSKQLSGNIMLTKL